MKKITLSHFIIISSLLYAGESDRPNSLAESKSFQLITSKATVKIQPPISEEIAGVNTGRPAIRMSGHQKVDTPYEYKVYEHSAYPDRSRQGGDTVGDAMVIDELPYYNTGTTEGYTDDYDEECPYSGSTSPDVV